jgi:hypothetical protein
MVIGFPLKLRPIENVHFCTEADTFEVHAR